MEHLPTCHLNSEICNVGSSTNKAIYYVHGSPADCVNKSHSTRDKSSCQGGEPGSSSALLSKAGSVHGSYTEKRGSSFSIRCLTNEGRLPLGFLQTTAATTPSLSQFEFANNMKLLRDESGCPSTSTNKLQQQAGICDRPSNDTTSICSTGTEDSKAGICDRHSDDDTTSICSTGTVDSMELHKQRLPSKSIVSTKVCKSRNNRRRKLRKGRKPSSAPTKKLRNATSTLIQYEFTNLRLLDCFSSTPSSQAVTI